MTADSIEQALYDLKDKGHAKLPPIRQLAKKLNTSPGKVHKSIVSLSAKGIIETQQGRGNFFRKPKTRTQKAKTLFTAVFSMKIVPHDGYALKIIDSLRAAAKKNKIELQIIDDCKADKPESWKKTLAQIDISRTKGFILPSKSAARHHDKFSQLAPCVIVNDTPLEVVEIPSFLPDYFSAGFLGAEHLAKQGHRRIGYLGQGKSFFSYQNLQHIAGMRLAARVYNVEFVENNIISLANNRHISAKQLTDLLETTKCTGFIARNDIAAALACNVIAKTKSKKVAIVGCGNYQRGINSPYPLTTIDYKYEQICEQAMDCLKKLNSNIKVSMDNLINPELIIRESA
jgi:DNA-binding LacI/PurR family transcriptional regulator